MRKILFALLLFFSVTSNAQVIKAVSTMHKDSINSSASSLLTGLVSYWKLDETSGNAADAVGSNTGTPNTPYTTQNVTGKINTCYEYSDPGGYNESVDMGSGLTIGTSSWSISVWLKMTSVARFYLIQWGADGGTSGIRIETNSDYHGSFIFGWTASYHEQASGLSVDLSDGSWHNVVCVFDRTGNAQMWIDGSAGTAYDISSHSADNISNTTNFTLGYNQGTSADILFDEVGLWNRALTPTEISTIYNSGSAKAYPFSWLIIPMKYLSRPYKSEPISVIIPIEKYFADKPKKIAA